MVLFSGSIIIQKLPNKIIIVIDDIDRLNHVEIRQIFQLVKSLGDFPNTTYLLAFDKDVPNRQSGTHILPGLNKTKQ
ncbi:MAG: P-loop NTPase fold protein, partial [Candidatus Omnitrophota bacterium]